MNTKLRMLAAFLLGFLGNSIATPIITDAEADADSSEPVLMTPQEQQQHMDKMRNMSYAEKIKYRNEQYEELRKRAAQIGYIMPITPPWAGMEQPPAEQPAVETAAEQHQKQLAKYRREAADKRKAMEERLEKQRQSIKQRINKLVQDNAVPSSDDSGSRYQPGYPRFAPPPPPRAPAYPPFYRVPPPYPTYAY
ncbi:MAG: hypothetical protein PVG66_06250 [Chromatiales bacterium]|jgi:hypothetical protein